MVGRQPVGAMHAVWQATGTQAAVVTQASVAPPCAQASGVGGSWWAEQACAGTNGSAINVVLTELESTRQL